MRTKTRITFWGHRIPGGAQTVLGAAAIGADAIDIIEFTSQRTHMVSVTVTLAKDDERLPRFFELLRQHEVDPAYYDIDDYTDEELDNARLLLLKPNRQCEVDGGSEFGTTYDLSGACPSCGAGARQTSALFLDGEDDELPKLEGHRAGCTYRDVVFIDDRLAAELDALAPTGLVFHQVYALMPDKRQVKLPYKQLSADRILPPMSPPTDDVERTLPCAVCTRSGYMTGSRPRVVYRAKDLDSAGDVNLSWEGKFLGETKTNPLECRIPVPLLLVTPKVMRVFRAAGVTEFEWVPIRVVDE